MFSETKSADKPTVQEVHTRFCETFGPPHQTLGKDFHWALRLSDTARPVNILMNGTRETAAVWIFDPVLDPAQAVYSIFIDEALHIDEVIKLINDRMKRADQENR